MWLISLISILITYNCHLNLFYFYYLQKIKTRKHYQYHKRAYGFISKHLVRYNLYWEHSSTYRKVITILFKYYSYCWVYTNDFLCYLWFCFHAWNVYITKNTEKRYLVIISSYRARDYEPQVDLRDQPIVVSEVGLSMEIDRYPWYWVLSGMVTITSLDFN